MSSVSENPTAFRFAFVGIVGPTNAGKSTLLNQVVGKKVSIVSSKAQTTYHSVRGILNNPEYQLVFVDTPGLQNHQESIAKLLNKVASQAAAQCDILVWVFDASMPSVFRQIERQAAKIQSLKAPVATLCVLNKVDLIKKESLLPLMAKLAELGLFTEIVPLSALKKRGTDRLVEVCVRHAPSGAPFYPVDDITDRSSEFLIKEIIREKVYQATHQEVPYSVYIEMEPEAAEGEEPRRVPEYRAVIHVDSPSRKAILLGKAGSMIKRIGTLARKDMETLLGRHLCLKLHVDVEPDWKNDSRKLETLLELR